MQEELEEIKRDRRKKIEDMSIEEMRHEQQLVDYKIKDITNDLDFNEWGSEVRKKEQAYNEEQYYAARRRLLSIPFVDEDDYIPLGDIIARYSTSKTITPDLPIEEPDNSLSMGDEHLDTNPSIENLVPIPSEFEGISDDTSDAPTCDNNRINVEELVEARILIPMSITYSSDDDDFEDIEYVILEEVNDVDQEDMEFDLEDIFQIQDVILREKLLNVHRLISNIESLNDNSTPDRVLKSPSLFPIPVTDSDSFLEESDTSFSHLDNSLPEFETFSDDMEETRSGKLPEFESFHFNPSFPRPPPESPDVEISLNVEPDAPVTNDFDELNEEEPFDPGESENVVFLNVEEDDSFTFTIRTFLPFLTYPEVSPLSCSTRSEDMIFDPGIFT
ncbi:hypothetical protein Tco_1025924 [Tanacetum coccineum]